MSFADRSRGCVPRLKEDFEGGSSGRGKVCGKPVEFLQLSDIVKTKCAYPPFSTTGRMT